jgi:SAM-dependent methyltransferase
MASREITLALVDGLEPAGPTDPIAFYRRPIVGWLYRERINRGLRLLPYGPLGRLLEVGYGSGTVLHALAGPGTTLHGIDLDSDPVAVADWLARRAVQAELRRGSVYELPYENGALETVVSFSVFEHLSEVGRAVGEVARVLVPGGRFLLGMPRVDKTMSAGFRLIGFRGIEEHHVTSPAQAEATFAEHGFETVATAHLDVPLRSPLGLRLYYVWLLEKRTG